jgi:hypothetical protein
MSPIKHGPYYLLLVTENSTANNEIYFKRAKNKQQGVECIERRELFIARRKQYLIRYDIYI